MAKDAVKVEPVKGPSKLGKYEQLAQEAVGKGQLKNLTPTFIEWEKGKEIIGKYMHRGTIETPQGPYCMYFFDTDNGIVKFSIGSYGDKEIGEQVVSGRIYSFIFNGKEELQGGKSVNKFTVYELFPPKDTVGIQE